MLSGRHAVIDTFFLTSKSIPTSIKSLGDSPRGAAMCANTLCYVVIQCSLATITMRG